MAIIDRNRIDPLREDHSQYTDQEKFDVASEYTMMAHDFRKNNNIPKAIQYFKAAKLIFEFLKKKGYRSEGGKAFEPMCNIIDIIGLEIKALENPQSNASHAVAEGQNGGDDDDSDELLKIGKGFLAEITSTHGLKNVAGLDEVKDLLRTSILLPLKQPQLFANRNSLKGCLLYGPPGTGKSFIAKALAKDANCETFFRIEPADVKNKYVGESEKTIKALFHAAHVLSVRYKKPAVIFIDEIDAIGESRDSGSQTTASTGLLTQLLISMDGMNSDGSTKFVIAATNRPDALDNALKRRLNKQIMIPLPDYQARAQILKQEMGDPVNWEPLDNEEIDEIVKMLHGYSGSDIRTICIVALNIPIDEAGKSKYFIELQGEDGEFYFTPCPELVEGGKKMSFDDIPDNKLRIRPASKRDLIAAINRCNRTVSSKLMQTYVKYQESTQQ